MRSDANEAPDARQEIIDVYMAWRHGKMATAGGSIDPVALGTAVATAVVAALEPWMARFGAPLPVQKASPRTSAAVSG